jgi:hypothetical protein
LPVLALSNRDDRGTAGRHYALARLERLPWPIEGGSQPRATCSTCWTATSNASEDGMVKPVWKEPPRRVDSASYPASAGPDETQLSPGVVSHTKRCLCRHRESDALRDRDCPRCTNRGRCSPTARRLPPLDRQSCLPHCCELPCRSPLRTRPEHLQGQTPQ